MTSQGPKRIGEEAKSKPYRIESLTDTSDDESEEMNRIREKLQRRRLEVIKDDDTISSDEDKSVAIEEPTPWNEDDDDDAFDAKLAAMNVFPPLTKTVQPERPSKAEDTFVDTFHHENSSDMNSGMPSLEHSQPNQHSDPTHEQDPFSDDDDLIAAIEYPETTWMKPRDNHSGDDVLYGQYSPEEFTTVEDRRDDSNQDSSPSVVGEPSFHRRFPTKAIKDTTAIDDLNCTTQIFQSPSDGPNRHHQRSATSSSIQPTTRDNGSIPPLSKQKKSEHTTQISLGNGKENINPQSSDGTSICLYEYAPEHQDWNGEDDWYIQDSEEDIESTPNGTNSGDPFGFDTEIVARNSGATRQNNDDHAREPNKFTDALSGGKGIEVVDGVDSKKYQERLLDDAFGFSDKISDTIPCKSYTGQHGAIDRLRVDPSSASDIMDEKNSEVDPSLYAPQPMDAIQEPIIHHLSPRNRPIQARRKIPIAQVFQGPVASLWKNKFEVFNHVQSEIANMLAYSDDNVVVSAPTGAGKTAVFEMAMARFFEVDIQATPPGRSEKMAISKRRKIVYMSPSKALCEERFADWSKRLSAMNLGIEIAVVTGDGDPSDAYHDLASSHFIITTPEKWDSLTRRWTEKFFLFASVKLFLVDEVHLIGDKSRGCCLETVICRMKAIQRAASQINVTQADINMSSFANTSPDAINTLLRFVAVSATLPNISDIAMFFEANEAYIFDESYRPVPLTIHVIGQGKLSQDASNGQFMFWKNLDRNVPELIFRFSNRRPAIVFCHSKADCEKLADLLATTQNIGRRDEATSGIASRTRVSKLQRVLIQGIAYHHAGLEVEDRRLIEESFMQGKISVLCATSTIAMGVNLPAHLVIIKGTSAYRGSGEGYQDIDQASLLQMIGRAGRPGFDTTGTAVIMTDNDSKTKFEQLASSGLSPAMSQLKGLKLVETINTEVSQKVICSNTNAINWIKGTLYFLQLAQDPGGHGLKVVSNYSIDTHLHNLCRNAIDRLCAIGAIVTTESQDIYPLPASHIMSQRLVDYEAMAQISKLPFDVSHSQVVKTISTIEGMHCPVRRNEKKALNAAHKNLKMYKLEGPLSKVRIQEPWQKSFVLIQAYIDELEFDDHDFAMKKEMNAMVEYAARTLTAVEEFSIKSTKNGNVTFQCMRIRRSIAVRLWSAKDGMLQQIKGIGKALAFSLHMNGISTFEDVMKTSEAQLEKAVSRPQPFGRDLRNASASILQSRLKISAQLDRTQNSNILSCALKRTCETTNDDSESFEKPTVTYTLLAYTDRAGGLFLVKQNISGPGSFQATLPQSYGLITIQLVASIVGLDGKFLKKRIEILLIFCAHTRTSFIHRHIGVGRGCVRAIAPTQSKNQGAGRTCTSPDSQR
jgi:replicative superfamily II helicase